MGKIVTKKQFKEEIRPLLKTDGKTIALCHGVFDLVHPGHIIHFEHAKSMADVLVVSITDAEHVRKGPGRPFFNDEMRVKELAAIEYIDYVLVSNEYTVDDIVEAVEPDLYVKGSEYRVESADITENIRRERELVEKHGGRIAYTDGDVFSSTKLINTGLSGLSTEVISFMTDFKQRYSMDDILRFTDKMKNLKLLVLGDFIIDKYTYCSVMGMMSKDMAYSAREKYTEEYYGGSAAIARHLSSFSDDVTLISVIGKEDEHRLINSPEILGSVLFKPVCSAEHPTIIKHRFLNKGGKRENYQKIFSINNLEEINKYEDSVYEELNSSLLEELGSYDVVFLCDFGHGMMSEVIQSTVQEHAKYIVLNCQTNSTNRGLNPITKYHRADAFSLDQTELKLAFPQFAGDENAGLTKLANHLKGKGWLTRGSDGAYAITCEDIVSCPALTLSVKDTVGAGDAFYSVAGIFYSVGASEELAMFMGNIAGALGANIVGNKDSVKKVDVLKFASTLMNV